MTTDKDTEALFTEDEWKEICSLNWTKLDEVDGSIKDYLQSFNHNDAQTLHEALDQPFSIGGQYNITEHWSFHWIRSTITKWFGCYKEAPSPMNRTDQLESFWRQDVYGMLNSMMLDVPRMPVVHGEPQLHESIERRNKKERATSTKKLPGFKVDGLFQVSGVPPLSVGVVEAAKTNKEHTVKNLGDFKKITQELHDILCARINGLHVRTRVHLLRVIGFLISGELGSECKNDNDGFLNYCWLLM